MKESTFASKAEVGQQYVTKAGFAVVMETNGAKPRVRDCATGRVVDIRPLDILRPFDIRYLSKEAIEMAKIHKAGNKVSGEKKTVNRGGSRGAKRAAEGIVLFRTMGKVVHEVLFHGGVLTYRTKDYMSLKEVAQAIRGKAVSGSGRSFFGLRSEPNISLGKEVLKGLSPAKEAPKKKASKPRKETAAVEDDDEAESPKSVADVVAKVMGRSRS